LVKLVRCSIAKRPELAAVLVFYNVKARSRSRLKNWSWSYELKLKIERRDRTKADSDLQPIVTTSASMAANRLLPAALNQQVY